MKAYLEDLKKILNSKAFLVAVLLVAVLSYGYAATNIAISIDDLEGARYTGEGNVMLQAGRFGTFLWSKLQGARHYSFTTDCVAVALFICAAINYSVLFRRISANRISIAACTVFSCVLISYPLINEVWEYTGTNILICGGFLLVSLALLIVHSHIHSKASPKPHKFLIGAALLMTWVCASYESIVPVYIFFVFAILALQIVYGEEKEKCFKEMLRQGLLYAGVLVAGLLLRFLLHRLYLLIADTYAVGGGATTILWTTEPFVDVLISWIEGTAVAVLHGIIYFPLTELLVAMVALFVIGICACRRHGAILLLPGFGMFFSLIILSVIQGQVSPYRPCQVYGAFVAFVVMLLVVIVQQHPWKRVKWMRPVALILAGYLCFQQAAYLNYFLTLNHLRSEEEAYVIRQVGTDLESEFDMEKPVIFVGPYRLSNYIQEAASISKSDLRWILYCGVIRNGVELLGGDSTMLSFSRKLPQTNVKSVLEWGWYAFNQEGMQNLFAYYGYNYVLADYDAVFGQANEYAIQNNMPSYPVDGYIQDVGDYIIVCLGDVY